jgi:hypothetical protein
LISLSTREARKKLSRRVDPKSRIEPYFIEHRHGVAIGYRPGTEPGTAGRWLLREFGGGRYVKRTLGTADDLVPADGVSVLSRQGMSDRTLSACETANPENQDQFR